MTLNFSTLAYYSKVTNILRGKGVKVKRFCVHLGTIHFQSFDWAEPTKWPADEVAQRGQAKAPYGQDKCALRLMVFTKFGI